MIIAKLIHIKSINNKCKNEPKNIINLKKTLIIHNTEKILEKLWNQTLFLLLSMERNKKKCYLIWWKKKQQKFVAEKQC